MRNTLLAAAVAAALTLASTDASAQARGSATKADMEALQAQMQALTDRLNRLETTNATLQNENAELKAVVERREAETDYLKAQTKDLREEAAMSSGELAKVKGSDWATRIKFKGDLRVRDENITQERVVDGAAEDAADRNRARYRVRFGFDAKVTDQSKVVVQLATGGDDPRSTNQTMGGEGSRKSIGLDLAYAEWNFMNGGVMTLGKVKYPFWRPGQSYFYDSDVNPEGIAVAFDRGLFFGSAYGWWLEERFNSSPTGQNADTNMFGAQLGLKFPLLGGETRVAAHYYDLGGGQGSNPFFGGNPFGNTTIPETIGTTTTQVLLYDYDVLMLSAEMGLALGNLPLSLWADYAQNTDADDNDTAYGIGATLGKASNAGTWEAGLLYQVLDKDALFAQMVDSDFSDGTTDSEGWVFKAGYAPVKNVTLNGTYLINTRNKDVGVELDYNRLQLDVNYKF